MSISYKGPIPKYAFIDKNTLEGRRSIETQWVPSLAQFALGTINSNARELLGHDWVHFGNQFRC